MRPDNHKKKQTREWQKKNGIQIQEPERVIVSEQPEYTEVLDEDVDTRELQVLLSKVNMEDSYFEFKSEKAAKTNYQMNDLQKELFELDLDALGEKLVYSDYKSRFRIFEFPRVDFGWTKDMVSPCNPKTLIKVAERVIDAGIPHPTVTKIKLAPAKPAPKPSNSKVQKSESSDINEWLDDLIG